MAASYDFLLDLVLVKVIDSITFSKAASYDLLLDLVESQVIRLRLRYIRLYHTNMLFYCSSRLSLLRRQVVLMADCILILVLYSVFLVFCSNINRFDS